MNTKTMFTIVALMAAIGMLGMHAIPSVPHAMAQGPSVHHVATVLQGGNDDNQGNDNNQGNQDTGGDEQ